MNNASPGRKSPALPFAIAAHALGVVLLLGSSLASSFAESSFKGLGFLPGGKISSASAVSDDGKVVVGWTSAPILVGGEQVPQAFRWTADGGMVSLGCMPGDYPLSCAFAVSSDGSVVAGYGAAVSGTEAFRWTARNGLVRLGYLSGRRKKEGAAMAMSSDGSVVAGDAGYQAFRWTAAGGMVGLESHMIQGAHSLATAISSDGKIIVGLGVSPLEVQAFRWTEADGMVGLGYLPGGSNSSAQAVSRDGFVIVGSSSSTSGTEPFRWTAAGGMVGLGHLPGSTNGVAWAVSGDGSVIVGVSVSKFDSDQTAFVWNNVNGTRRLQSVLSNDYHLNLTGWKLQKAKGISADGTTIVGDGDHNGNMEAWVVHLDRPLNAPAGKERSR